MKKEFIVRPRWSRRHQVHACSDLILQCFADRTASLDFLRIVDLDSASGWPNSAPYIKKKTQSTIKSTPKWQGKMNMQDHGDRVRRGAINTTYIYVTYAWNAWKRASKFVSPDWLIAIMLDIL